MANNNENMFDMLGKSLKDQFQQAGKTFSQWLSVNSAVTLAISETKNPLSELKEINTLMAEIRKINAGFSKSQMENIVNNSFDIASKYGKKSTDYLSGVQAASKAGYKDTEGIAELSLAAQATGNLTAELANSYIIAADKAYKMNGSIQALTETLDGANNITNNHTVDMTELAKAMSAVSFQAAVSQMDVNETTAAVAALIATTQADGSEMGNAFKGILMNLQQMTGTIDGEVIDTESLISYKNACEHLGVSLSEVRNGIVTLKEPMQILKELSQEYTKLNPSDDKRSNLLSAVGGGSRAEALNAILENYSLYEKMLQDYADGTGSMKKEAEKTAQSWEGSLTRLSNTWTETVGNIADSDAVTTAINGLNGILSVVNDITGALGSFGSIGIGAGLFAGIKNAGRAECSPSYRICLR